MCPLGYNNNKNNFCIEVNALVIVIYCFALVVAGVSSHSSAVSGIPAPDRGKPKSSFFLSASKEAVEPEVSLK